MIAALGMYDLPSLRPANDRYWSLIRSALGYGPVELTRVAEPWDIWLNPDLLFAQTCGMPFRTRLYGHVQLVGTPDYGLSGCPPGHYRSVFVARARDSRGLADLSRGTFAYNEATSQSGWAGPLVHLERMGLCPLSGLETGSHAMSARAVAEGDADFAALDALTWLMLKEHTKLGTELRDVDATEPTPALPYVTSGTQDATAVAKAVRHAINALPPRDRNALHLLDLITIPAQDYLATPNPSPNMVKQLIP
ncbi:PhnD/SsuA/transferrin family substrate-binding protein [Ruegeria sp. R8_1]|uniref:phosphate/phosphite/phosphonate ABC transporter substrate-binding protein n=1 Tax=unclassified Ruegeria TaxID=2625375 RepID=UPI0032AEED47